LLISSFNRKQNQHFEIVDKYAIEVKSKKFQSIYALILEAEAKGQEYQAKLSGFIPN